MGIHVKRDDFIEDTSARECKEKQAFLWYFARLSLPLPPENNKKGLFDMEAITFTPAQVHVFNLVSHIKSALGLEQLRQQLAAFYAKQVDDEMDALWESGQFDEKRLEELRGSHFRTPYTK